MSKITLKEASKQIGKADNYLSTIKSALPKKYRIIKFFGKGDLVKGYFKLQEKIDEINKEFEELYFSFERPYDFAKAIAKKGIYSDPVIAINAIDGFWGKETNLVGVRTKLRILKAFKGNK
jgi:hypothetical protein